MSCDYGFCFVLCFLSQVWCVFVRALALFAQINHILQLKVDTVAEDPVLYFQLFRRVLFLATFSAWFAASWCKYMELRTFAMASYKALTGNYCKVRSFSKYQVCQTYAIIIWNKAKCSQ